VNVEILKEEQDASKLHEEIKGMGSLSRNTQQRTNNIPKKVAKKKTKKVVDRKEKTQMKKKGKNQEPLITTIYPQTNLINLKNQNEKKEKKTNRIQYRK
jgi:hypothetical protein